MFGTSSPEWWRVLEHVGWVVFEDIVLMYGCARAVGRSNMLAEREARLEAEHANVEQQVVERTQQLEAEIAERRARETTCRPRAPPPKRRAARRPSSSPT